MGTRFPGLTAPRHPAGPAPRRRPGGGRPGGGRHTSLVGSPDDDNPPAGYPSRDPDGYPPGYPAREGQNAQGTRVHIRGENGYGSGGPGADYGSSVRGTGYGSSAPGAGNHADTVVMGDLGLFSGRRTGEWPKVGVNREPPPRPWFQHRARLAIVVAGLATVGFAGFAGVPALLNALGIGTAPQGPCPVCEFPIPSSAAVPPGSGSSPATAAPSATTPARTSPSAAAPTPPAPVAVVPQPRSTPAGQTITPLGVTYSATPEGDNQFTGQVTVVNRGMAPVTNWQMVVALPYDTVSAVQNAEISDQNDVLFLSPAPEDLSIPPGGTVIVSVFASGPTTTPAECSFNNVPCQ